VDQPEPPLPEQQTVREQKAEYGPDVPELQQLAL
jgi:hypothetical protein